MTTLPVGGTQEDVRRRNLAALLTHLHLGGPLRRSELTDLLGVNRSTVAALVGELAGLGLVREEKPAGAQPGAGRPSPVVHPCAEAVQVVAVDVAVERVTTAVVGLGGAVQARRETPLADGDPATVAQQVAVTTTDLLAGLGRDLPADRQPRPIAVALSVPGVVSAGDGAVRLAPNLGWVDAPLGRMTATALAGAGLSGPHVLVGNDADLGALAEQRRGAARGIDDVVFVEGEVGVGCGLIVGGRPVVGAGGYAGELGHMTIRPDGLPCRCGSRGCWETEIGAPAIARALGLPGAHVDVVAAALADGGEDRATALRPVGQALGLGLANVINVLNPRLVVLGALLGLLLPLVRGPVAEELQRGALTAPREQARIVPARLGTDAVLIGAAELAWGRVLADPIGALRAAGPG